MAQGDDTGLLPAVAPQDDIEVADRAREVDSGEVLVVLRRREVVVSREALHGR